MKHRTGQRGFTLIEVLIVIGIIGAMMALTYPSIMNSLETRNLDNSAREIQTTLQQARYRAVTDKVHYRVRFAQQGGLWRLYLESLDEAGNWNATPGYLERSISPRFVLTLNLPASQAVEFSPVGTVESYDSTHNSVRVLSPKLQGGSQPDLRILTVFSGGTIRYERTRSS